MNRTRFWSLLEAAGVIATVGTLTAFAARQWWVFDLAAHFRVQYVLGLGALAGLLALAQRWRTMVIVGAGLMVNAAFLVPCYTGPNTPPATTDTPRVRLLLSNVHTANQQFSKLRDYVRAVQPDILAVLEADERWAAGLAELNNDYPHRCGRVRDDNFGILLLSKRSLASPRIINLAGFDAPSIVTRFELGERSVSLLVTHPVPPKSANGTVVRNQQLAAAAAAINELPAPRVLLGDLNVTPWSPYFQELLAATGLRDSARGWGLQPSWPTMSLLLRVPIDHCLISPELHVTERTLGPDIGSDHFPLLVTLAVQRPSASQ